MPLNTSEQYAWEHIPKMFWMARMSATKMMKAAQQIWQLLGCVQQAKGLRGWIPWCSPSTQSSLWSHPKAWTCSERSWISNTKSNSCTLELPRHNHLLFFIYLVLFCYFKADTFFELENSDQGIAKSLRFGDVLTRGVVRFVVCNRKKPKWRGGLSYCLLPSKQFQSFKIPGRYVTNQYNLLLCQEQET